MAIVKFDLFMDLMSAVMSSAQKLDCTQIQVSFWDKFGDDWSLFSWVIIVYKQKTDRQTEIYTGRQINIRGERSICILVILGSKTWYSDEPISLIYFVPLYHQHFMVCTSIKVFSIDEKRNIKIQFHVTKILNSLSMSTLTMIFIWLTFVTDRYGFKLKWFYIL